MWYNVCHHPDDEWQGKQVVHVLFLGDSTEHRSKATATRTATEQTHWLDTMRPTSLDAVAEVVGHQVRAALPHVARQHDLDGDLGQEVRHAA
jgi:hypothetical protein